MIIARPNQSASWDANVLLLAILAIPVLGIAVVFALLGAWVILPFAGLELLALGAALYKVNCRQQYRHVITVSDDSVCIDKGYHTPQEHWELARDHSGLTVTTQPHPCDTPLLCLHDHHASVTLGEFLNREESLELLGLLQQEIRVRAYSGSGLRKF